MRWCDSQSLVVCGGINKYNEIYVFLENEFTIIVYEKCNDNRLQNSVEQMRNYDEFIVPPPNLCPNLPPISGIGPPRRSSPGKYNLCVYGGF